MKNLKSLSLSILIITAFSCKDVKKEGEKAMDKIEAAAQEMKEEIQAKTLKFKLDPKSDSNVTGDVTFTEKNGTVSMEAVLTGLTPGEHAIHIHEKADCSSA